MSYQSFNQEAHEYHALKAIETEVPKCRTCLERKMIQTSCHPQWQPTASEFKAALDRIRQRGLTPDEIKTQLRRERTEARIARYGS